MYSNKIFVAINWFDWSCTRSMLHVFYSSIYLLAKVMHSEYLPELWIIYVNANVLYVRSFLRLPLY